MDASSFEVERRARRAKSDRIDVRKLSGLLIRKENGEERAYRRVNVPEEQVEIDRDLHRERSALKSDETRLRNRLTALLVRHGIFVALKRDLGERFESLRDWQDRPLPRAVIERCQRLWAQLELVKAHIKALEKQQREAMAKDDAAAQQMRMLQVLKGLDQQIPWVLVRELFGWRKFKNGRQVGGLAGLTPTPYASGSMSREQGISKHGIARIRSLAVELAWLWVRYQPDSPLTQWFKRRYANGGKRQRRIGIVAVARKLLIALWRYLETGVLPEGALVKA
jgi:transposase